MLSLSILVHSIVGNFSLLGSGHVLPALVLGDLGAIQTDLMNVLNNIKTLLQAIGVTVAVIGIMVGGLMRATAFGNERKVAISNQAIACAVVGLAIVLIAQVAATAVQSFFGG